MIENRTISNFTIFPNPVRHVAFIRMNEPTPVVNYTITDAAGRVVRRGSVYDKLEFSIPLADFPSGIYAVTINQITKKLYLTK